MSQAFKGKRNHETRKCAQQKKRGYGEIRRKEENQVRQPLQQSDTNAHIVSMPRRPIPRADTTPITPTRSCQNVPSTKRSFPMPTMSSLPTTPTPMPSQVPLVAVFESFVDVDEVPPLTDPSPVELKPSSNPEVLFHF